MDFKAYDTAFATKLGAAADPGGRGFVVEVAGVGTVDLFFDLPEEWWGEESAHGGKYTLPAINLRRLDLILDPSRHAPNFRPTEVSQSEPNMFNRMKGTAVPVTLLYGVQVAADSMHAINALQLHLLLSAPPMGYGANIEVHGRVVPIRSNSVRNLTQEGRTKRSKRGREFAWEYTYAVEGWIASTECVKVPQILQVDLTFETLPDGNQTHTSVDENGVL